LPSIPIFSSDVSDLRQTLGVTIPPSILARDDEVIE
jgi:hypothetical protein